MSANQAFKNKLAAIDALRADSDSSATHDALRQALRDRNNYVVARAAAVCSDLHLDPLIPDLLAAFERFFHDAAKTDAQCLAKTAIAKALRSLGHHGADAFLRGIVHVQLEPTFGGRADSAASLRGTCALALTDCALDDLAILTYLTDALADADPTVRVDTAMAIEQLNRPEGALLLRLKLLIGDPDPSVMRQCFASMLSLTPEGVVSFVARFLKSDNDDVQVEAAGALAECRDPRAVEILREFWQEARVSQDVRQAVLIGLGASPIRAAAEFLLQVASTEAVPLAITAISALSTSRFRSEFQERLTSAVRERDSQQLSAVFESRFAAPLQA